MFLHLFCNEFDDNDQVPTSPLVLTPCKYDRRYRQEASDVVFCQFTLTLV